MKTTYLFAATTLAFLFYSCNPSAGKEFPTEYVKLNAELSSTKETITLGDTLKIRLKLPDTITGSSITQTVHSLI